MIFVDTLREIFARKQKVYTGPVRGKDIREIPVYKVENLAVKKEDDLEAVSNNDESITFGRLKSECVGELYDVKVAVYSNYKKCERNSGHLVYWEGTMLPLEEIETQIEFLRISNNVLDIFVDSKVMRRSA